MRVALFVFVEVGANLATVGNLGLRGPTARDVAGTAGHRAYCPGRPRTDNTINRTGLDSAR